MSAILTPDQVRRRGAVNPFIRPKYERRAKGYFIVDGMEVAATMQCCHCGNHYVSVVGSGKRRGWCVKCNQTTCGAGACDVCLPFEKKVEAMERRSRLKQRGLIA